MRIFAILLLVLGAGFGWALWQGMDVVTGLLVGAQESTPDGPVAGQGRYSSEAATEVGASAAITPEPSHLAAEQPAEPDTPLKAASEEHAISSREVTSESQSAPAGAPAPGTALKAAVTTAAIAPDTRRITGDRVNLRQGPEVGASSVGLLSLDEVVEVLEVGGDWLRVRTEDGEVGWVSTRFLGPFQG